MFLLIEIQRHVDRPFRKIYVERQKMKLASVYGYLCLWFWYFHVSGLFCNFWTTLSCLVYWIRGVIIKDSVFSGYFHTIFNEYLYLGFCNSRGGVWNTSSWLSSFPSSAANIRVVLGGVTCFRCWRGDFGDFTWSLDRSPGRSIIWKLNE